MKTNTNSQLEALQQEISKLEEIIKNNIRLKQNPQLKAQVNNLRAWCSKVKAKLVQTSPNHHLVLSNRSNVLNERIEGLRADISLFVKNPTQSQDLIKKVGKFIAQNPHTGVKKEGAKKERESLIQKKPTPVENLRKKVSELRGQEDSAAWLREKKVAGLLEKKRSTENSFEDKASVIGEVLKAAREMTGFEKAKSKKTVSFGNPKFVLGKNNLNPQKKLTQFVAQGNLASVEGLLKRDLNSGAGYKIPLAAKKRAFKSALEGKDLLMAETISSTVLTVSERKELEDGLDKAKAGKPISELLDSPEKYENCIIEATRHYVNNPKNPDEPQSQDRELKSIHGVPHCVRTTVLAEELVDLYQVNGVLKNNPAEKRFIALLAAFHDASRVHEKLDKNEFPNGELFYQFALKNGFSLQDAILGGLIISCKGVGDGKADEDSKEVREAVENFLKGNNPAINGNGVTISQKVSSKNLTAEIEKYTKMVMERMAYINIINLADTVEVMRVRLSTSEDVEDYNVSSAKVLGEVQGKLVEEHIKNILTEKQLADLAKKKNKKVEGLTSEEKLEAVKAEATKAFSIGQNYLDPETKTKGTGEFGPAFVLPKLGKGMVIEKGVLLKMQEGLTGIIERHKKTIVDDVQKNNGGRGYFKNHRLWERREGEMKFLLGAAGLYTQDQLKGMELSTLGEVIEAQKKVADLKEENPFKSILDTHIFLVYESIAKRDEEKEQQQEYLEKTYGFTTEMQQDENFGEVVKALYQQTRNSNSQHFALGQGLDFVVQTPDKNQKIKDPINFLFVIDPQNDFCKSNSQNKEGALAVKDNPKSAGAGEELMQKINHLMENGQYSVIFAAQDSHPTKHQSFANQHFGKAVFSEGKVGGKDQTLWPDHCVIGTEGWKFHKALNAALIQFIVPKGFDRNEDSYSIFAENGKSKTSTGLKEFLKKIISQYVADLRANGNLGQDEKLKLNFDFCGLATDYCVKFSAIDAIEFVKNELKNIAEITVRLIEDASKGLFLGSDFQYSQKVKDEVISAMREQGVKVCQIEEVVKVDVAKHSLVALNENSKGPLYVNREGDLSTDYPLPIFLQQILNGLSWADKGEERRALISSKNFADCMRDILINTNDKNPKFLTQIIQDLFDFGFNLKGFADDIFGELKKAQTKSTQDSPGFGADQGDVAKDELEKRGELVLEIYNFLKNNQLEITVTPPTPRLDAENENPNLKTKPDSSPKTPEGWPKLSHTIARPLRT